MFTTQFLSAAGSITADSLPHLVVLGNALTERSDADNLLLYRCKLLQLETRLST